VVLWLLVEHEHFLSSGAVLLKDSSSRVVLLVGLYFLCSVFWVHHVAPPVLLAGCWCVLPALLLGLGLFLENSIASTSIFLFVLCVFCFSSYEEPTVDALAPRADEGRGYAAISHGELLPSFDPWMSEWGNPPSRRGGTAA
jgi:hypothetical protein